jgi:hypothetical protein
MERVGIERPALFALAKILDVRPEELLAGKFLEEEPIRNTSIFAPANPLG